MKKVWYGLIAVLVLIVILVLAFSGNDSNNQQSGGSIDSDTFNRIAMQSLYDNGFCLDNENGVNDCGEAEYPFIRVYGAEDFTEQGKLLLVTQVTDDLYEEIPSLYDKEITFVFRDQNQQSVDRIYIKENKWSR